MEKVDVRLDFDKFPARFTCDGENVSPRVTVTGAKGACMALIVDDPDAPSGTFTHWVIWNIMPAGSLPERIPRDPIITAPISGVQGRNSFTKVGYMGPCPPGHTPHRYYFKVYVLERKLDLPPGSGKHELEKAMNGLIVQSGEAMATYSR